MGDDRSPTTSDAASTIARKRVYELRNPQGPPNPMDLIRLRGHILVERWEDLNERGDEVGAAHVADEIAFLNALWTDLLEEMLRVRDRHALELAELARRVRRQHEPIS